jgi:Protein of unknown function (DUF559)
MADDDPTLREAVRRARRQHGALTRSQAIHEGLTPARLKRLVATGTWTSPVRGTFVVAGIPDALRARAQAAALMCPGAVVYAITAARLHELAALPPERGDEPIHLVLPRGDSRAQRRGITLRWSNLLDEEITELDRLRVTTVQRTLADMVLRTNREQAVAMLDAALNGGRISPEEIPAIRLMTRGRAGCGRSAGWWRLVDGRAESPLETRIRLLLLDAGHEPEALQWLVEDRGTPVARLDLAWPSRRLALEADGAEPHQRPEALYRDRIRQNALVTLGWRVLRFTWDDALHQPAWIIDQVRRYL